MKVLKQLEGGMLRHMSLSAPPYLMRLYLLLLGSQAHSFQIYPTCLEPACLVSQA